MIMLIKHACSLSCHLSMDNLINILQELFALPLVINTLHLLYIDQVSELVLPDGVCLAACSELGLAVFQERLAEDLKTLVEVFHLYKNKTTFMYLP